MAKWKSAPVPEETSVEAEAEPSGSDFSGLSLGDGFDTISQISVPGFDIPTAAIALPIAIGALYLALVRAQRKSQRRVRRHHNGETMTELPPATPSGQ